MQQQNSPNNAKHLQMRNAHQDTLHASSWVVDSKPLEPGKLAVNVVHRGSDSVCSTCCAPAVKKNK